MSRDSGPIEAENWDRLVAYLVKVCSYLCGQIVQDGSELEAEGGESAAWL